MGAIKFKWNATRNLWWILIYNYCKYRFPIDEFDLDSEYIYLHINCDYMEHWQKQFHSK